MAGFKQLTHYSVTTCPAIVLAVSFYPLRENFQYGFILLLLLHFCSQDFKVCIYTETLKMNIHWDMKSLTIIHSSIIDSFIY